MSFGGPDSLIDQDGLSHVSKKPRTSVGQTTGFPKQLSTSRPLIFQASDKKRSCPERSCPLQEERSVEKRSRLGVEIYHDRPALVELPQNLGSSPNSPAGHLVMLDGRDGVPVIDVAASVAQITTALQAPVHQDHHQHAAEHAADDSDAAPSFTPRTPQPKAKAAAVYDDKEWQRFFDVLQLNTPSRQQEGAVQAEDESQQLAGSFFLREFGRCSQTLRNRSNSAGVGDSGGTPVQGAGEAAQAPGPLPELGAGMH